jgi:hypothetical protein
MARNFDGSTQLDLQAADAAVMHIAEPYAISLWVKNASNPGSFLYALSKVLQAGSHPSYGFSTDGSGNFRFIQGHNTAGGFVVSPTVAAATIWDGNWHHVMGSADGTKVRIYLDGIEVGTGTTQLAATAYSALGLYVGSFDGPTNALYFKGGIGEIAVFNAIPDANERAALAQAYSALAVRPTKVAMCFPMLGEYSPEIDLAGGINLTNNGTIQVLASLSPRIILPC